MDKITTFLERHVQWLVLSLALLYVLYAAYAFLYSSPLTVKIGSVVAKPGEVDPKILANFVEPIERDIAKTDVKKPEIANVWDDFRAGLAEGNIRIPDLAVAWANSRGGTVSAEASAEARTPESPIDHLPKLPPATPLGKEGKPRRTVILTASGTPQDISYNSAIFTIDSNKLLAAANEAFDKTGVPPGLFRIEFAQVELLREELKANGSWSAPVVVKTLPINEVLPYPADNAAEAEWFKYREWMDANQDAIVRPVFYPTAPDAEGWVPPGAAPLQVAPQPGQPVIAERPFDPGRDSPKTAEQRELVKQYRAQEVQRRKAAARQRQTGGAPGMIPGSGYPPIMPNYDPIGMPGTKPRPSTPSYGAPPGYGMQPPPGAPGMNPYRTANPNPNPYANPNGNPNVNRNNPAAAGQDPNNPNGLLQDPQILVHDATIEEGKTYRYAVRYKLYNPLFGNAANFATREVTRKFAIVSPDPADPAVEKANPGIWTDKVSLEPSTHIFVTNISLWNSQATFEIFVWENGRWHQASSPKLMPGDPVNAPKSNTAWTIVDVRKDPRTTQIYVILMDGHGVLQRRDVDSDKVNEEFQKLKQEVGAAAAAR